MLLYLAHGEFVGQQRAIQLYRDIMSGRTAGDGLWPLDPRLQFDRSTIHTGSGCFIV